MSHCIIFIPVSAGGRGFGRSEHVPRGGAEELRAHAQLAAGVCLQQEVRPRWVLFVDPFMPTVPTFAVQETASLSIMGAPRVPPLNPSESIVL